MPRTLAILFALITLSAAPPSNPTDTLVRAGNAAARSGDFTRARQLYDEASERTTDPGLIAFNAGGLFFELAEYREAELSYLRCLEDREIPAQRKQHATFNRGVCLLKRGGPPKIFRTAIQCFEECVASATDERLLRDAKHNLELAKLLWHEARAKQKERPIPNELPEPEEPPPMRKFEPEEFGHEPTEPGTGEGNLPNTAMAPNPTPGGAPKATQESQQPGKGTLPVLDSDAVQKLTPADTNALLEVADGRLRKARKLNEQMRAGPERPHVRDW